MSQTLHIEVNQQDIERLIAKAGAIGAVDTLRKAITSGGLFLSTWIIKRITGPRATQPPHILGSKSGRLRSSIGLFNFLTDREGASVRIGTNVEYAPIHEYGGVIHRFARSETFLRKRFVRGAKKGSFKKGTSGFGQGFTFKSYDINIPARPFLRPAIEDADNINAVKEIIADKIHDAIEGA